MDEFLVFRLDDLRVALRASAVDRVVHAVAITPLPRAPAVVLGVINVHGRVVPVVDLRQRFNLPARELALTDRFVIARTSRRLLTVVADSIEGVFDYPGTSITPPADVLPGIEQVEGIVRREDGVVFIHDIERFLSLGEGASLDAAMTARGAGREDGHAS